MSSVVDDCGGIRPYLARFILLTCSRGCAGGKVLSSFTQQRVGGGRSLALANVSADVLADDALVVVVSVVDFDGSVGYGGGRGWIWFLL